MRVALVSEHASPLTAVGGVDAGGQNVHVAALATHLARRGHDVTVFTRRDGADVPRRVETADGYAVEAVPAGPPHPVPKDELLQHMPAFGRYLQQRWDEDPVDVGHAHFWMSGVASTPAARLLRIPLVQTFHALGTVKRRNQGAADTSPPERLWLERKLCQDVDHVVATCSDETRELAAMGLRADKVTVIPCGVDTDVFRPPPSQSRPPQVAGLEPHPAGGTLLVVGRLVERKGIGNVLEALAALPGSRLLVAGGPPAGELDNDPQRVRLDRLADRLGVADRVRFLGAVDRPDMPPLMWQSDVVVAVPWYEPFGIVPVEAMACGRPVVGSAVGGLLDTVVPGVTGELVPPRRPDLLAPVLAALLADPDRRAAYGRAGRDRAERLYRWSAVAEATEAVYERIRGSYGMRPSGRLPAWRVAGVGLAGVRLPGVGSPRVRLPGPRLPGARIPGSGLPKEPVR